MAAVAALVVAGAGVGTWYVLQPDYAAPDLAWRQEFPVGFARYPGNATAVAFDGQSQCSNVLDWLDFKPEPWTQDGIAYTKANPSAKDVLQANPLPHPYSYAGSATAPRQVDSEELPQIRKTATCLFQYEATAWRTWSDITNTEPILIPDVAGTPYVHARTDVKLAGNGDGQGGTRFALTGTTTLPDLAITYQVYEKGKLDYRYRSFERTAAATLEANNSFVVIFDVPLQHHADATLVLVPVHADLTAARIGEVELQTLHRLEPEEAQVIVGAQQPVTAPASKGQNVLQGGHVFRGKTLEEAGQKAAASDTVRNLEAASHTAFLVQKAFEPAAPLGKTLHLQAVRQQHLTTRTTLMLAEPGSQAVLVAEHTWISTKTSTTFVVRQSTTTLASDVAAATASLTQIGADGIAIVRATGDGPSIKAAIESTHRLLDARGEVETLATPRSTAALSRSADRYFLAAGVLHAGWEWSEAMGSDDNVQKLVHHVSAARILAETVFSLNPQGAIVVAALNVGAWAVSKVVPDVVKEALSNGINAIAFGRVTKANARSAFQDTQPHLQAFAREHDANFLPYEVRETREVPAGGELITLALALAVLVQRRRAA